MTEQHECELMCDTIATTIDDARDRGLSLVAVNVVLLEKTLEKLAEHSKLKRATEALTAKQARDISNRNLTVSEHEDLQAYADALAG